MMALGSTAPKTIKSMTIVAAKARRYRQYELAPAGGSDADAAEGHHCTDVQCDFAVVRKKRDASCNATASHLYIQKQKQRY